MPHTMELKDGTVTTLLQYKDFLELVDSYMGYEARRYLEEMQCDLAGLEKDMEYTGCAASGRPLGPEADTDICETDTADGHAGTIRVSLWYGQRPDAQANNYASGA